MPSVEDVANELASLAGRLRQAAKSRDRREFIAVRQAARPILVHLTALEPLSKERA